LLINIGEVSYFYEFTFFDCFDLQNALKEYGTSEHVENLYIWNLNLYFIILFLSKF
jgi:hypothetical protein